MELLVRESLLDVEQKMSTADPEATGMRFQFV